MRLYGYSRCSTCQKAKNWLQAQGEPFEFVDMVKEPPTKEQLMKWIQESTLPTRRFFNTSGKKYRALGLKEQVDRYTLEEACQILSTDGMLIKRPILVDDRDHFLTIGFNENDYGGIFAS